MIRDNFYLVANNIKPYAFEAAKVLALPAGCQFKGRFTRNWVQSDIVSHPEDLVGKTGYYLLRDWKQDRLIPLREITVLDVILLGDIIVVEYVVGSYLSYESNEDLRKVQLEDFNESFSKATADINSERVADGSMTPLIFTSNATVTISNSNPYAQQRYYKTSEKWLNTIYELSGMNIFEGMSFVLPLVFDNKGKIVSCRNNRITVKSGKEYTIKLVHYVLDVKVDAGDRQKAKFKSYMSHGPYRIKYFSPNHGICVCPDKLTATGRYDVVKSSISVDSKSSGEKLLIIEPTVPGFAKDSYDPKISVNLFIPFSYMRYLTQLLVLIVSLSIYSLLEHHDILDKTEFPKMHKFLSSIFIVIFTVKLMSFAKSAREMIAEAMGKR